MDLQKMDPIARKLTQHTEAFQKALADGNTNEASVHLSEIQKCADYLAEDISAAIVKQEEVGETPVEYAGNAAIRKYNNADVSPAGVISGQPLPGFISSGRHNSAFKPHSGTLGRQG
mgnify:CR=1 FL=1